MEDSSPRNSEEVSVTLQVRPRRASLDAAGHSLRQTTVLYAKLWGLGRACPLPRAHLGSIGPSLRGWHRGTVVGTAAQGGQRGRSGPLPAGWRSDRPMSLGKLSPPQDLEEDTQLSDKGEEARGLSRRNLTKASSWWQVGSCLDLQHTRCVMLVPGGVHPSPGPRTFMPHYTDEHTGAQRMSNPQNADRSPI